MDPHSPPAPSASPASDDPGEALASPRRGHDGVVPAVIRDEAVIAAAEEYAAAKAQFDRLEARLKELRPVIVAAMGDAPQARAGWRTLILAVVPAVPATPDVVIDASMVGRTIPGRKGRAAHTQLRVL